MISSATLAVSLGTPTTIFLQVLKIRDTNSGTSRRRFGCRASWQELAGVLLFSAFPFTAVKAIANSRLGKRLEERMQETKLEAQRKAPEVEAAERNAKIQNSWYGWDRPKWLGPIPYQYPQHLDGEYPGDYGFDILLLGKDEDDFAKYFKALPIVKDLYILPLDTIS